MLAAAVAPRAAAPRAAAPRAPPLGRRPLPSAAAPSLRPPAPRRAAPSPARPLSRRAEIASEALKGRVFELNLADLNKDEDQAYRKFKLQCEEVQGRFCLTQFYGMSFTTDKIRSMVRKWQTLVEAHVDVKTTDGYVVRLFCIGFTKKRMNQLKKTCYANSSQQKSIRRKMREIMTKEASTCELKELVNKFIPEVIGKEIEKACHGVYPLQNTFIRKVKMLKKPKFDLTKLLEIHNDGAGNAMEARTDETGEKVVVADLGEGAVAAEVLGA